MPVVARRWLLPLLMTALLVTGAVLHPAEAAPAAPPSPASPAFTAPGGRAGAWITPGPDPELWLAAAGQAPRLALAGHSQIFGPPVWSPDGAQVAVLVMPAGTETAALGQWWIAGLADPAPAQPTAIAPAWLSGAHLAPPSDADRCPAQFSTRPQEPAPPLIAAGGAGASPSHSPSALTPPATIRVRHTSTYNSCRSYLPDGTVTLIPFEEYVARVLPSEVYASWQPAALQAQAVAARTYAWNKILEHKMGYDISDGPDNQNMCDSRDPRTDAAVAATAGWYAGYGGQIISAQYSADNSHPTREGNQPYLKAVLDPVSLGSPRYGHGLGLSQWGAQRWALHYGWNAVQILAHYYTGVQVVDATGGAALVTLLTPWPGSWITGSAAYLTAHANPEWASVVTYTVPPAISLPAGTATNAWAAAWPAAAGQAGPFHVMAATGVGAAELTLAGVDRIPPSGALSLPAATGTPTVTANLTVADPGGSGVAGVALGADWEAQGEALWAPGGAGGLRVDDEATTGVARWLAAGPATSWRTSFVQELPVGHKLRAFIRIKYGAAGQERPLLQSLARVELYDTYNRYLPVDPQHPTICEQGHQYESTLMGFSDLRVSDFVAPGVYQEFSVDFALTDNCYANRNGRLLLYLNTTGATELTVDRILVLPAPQPWMAQMSVRLPEQSGSQRLVAKVVDAAGNASADLAAGIIWTPAESISEWQLISPTGWVTDTTEPSIVARVTGHLAGLTLSCISLPESCPSWRVSSDGGLTWSAWTDIVPVQVADGVAELSFRWPQDHGQGGAWNRVQFWVGTPGGEDAAGPRWPIRIDTQAPTVPELVAPATVAAATPFTMTMLAADNYLVAAYDFQESLDGVAWDGPVAAAGEFRHPPLRPGVHYLRARARDVAGNPGPWSAPRPLLVAGETVFLPLLDW